MSVLALSGCGLGLHDPEPLGPWSLRGEPVSGDQIESEMGPEHCGWQGAQFLRLSWPPGRTDGALYHRRTYVKDPKGVLDFAPYLRDGYDADAALPKDAVDTGYRNSGYALWYSLGAGDSTIYLVRTGGQVEAWPKAAATVGCA